MKLEPLDTRERRVLHLWLEGHTRTGIATHVGITLGQVASALKRARDKGYNTARPGERSLGNAERAAERQAKMEAITLRQPVEAKDGRLGRISSIQGDRVIVQFGADGPFQRLRVGSLTLLTEEDIKGTHLEGTG